SNSVVLELQQAAAATVFNETAHLDYPWQINLGNQSGVIFSPIPSPQNNSRLRQTFATSSTSNTQFQENPNVYSNEYDDGKIISLFKDGFQTNNGLVISPSISLWSYPKSGIAQSLSIDNLNEDLSIPLSSNFSHFRSCKPYVKNNYIYAFCNTYESVSEQLDLGNNTSFYIQEEQDLLIQWNQTGHLINYWAPHINSTSNQWNNGLRLEASAKYIWNTQFSGDSLFMLLGTTSTDSIDFPNGSIECPFTGSCRTIVKVNLNGTVEDFISLTYYQSNIQRNSPCNNVDRFEISNNSAIQLTIQNGCSIYDSSANLMTSPSVNSHLGFDLNLNYIRSIPESPCSGMNIYEADILPEKSYYITKGGSSSGCNSNAFIPVSMQSDGDDSIVSMLPNGTIDWSYSWTDNGNSLDRFGLIVLSYGIIWTGPKSTSELNWGSEYGSRIPPHFGPGGNNRDWSPIISHTGNWLDIHDGIMCSGVNSNQQRPIIYSEFSNGFSCGYYDGNAWMFASFAIDLDGDGVGHNADVFPFDSSQQTDADLDGFGDNIF
ncbi:MAG: hypothetical protein ACKVG2_07715, partial [Candidatus Poseidoniales archaeon]